MKKDLKSYEKHNSEYEVNTKSFLTEEEMIKMTEEVDMFRTSGYENALRMSNPLPKLHIDIGSGAGWLARKTSPMFDKVIGIEPSHAAVDLAKKVNKDNKNVSFLEDDMIDAFHKINVSEPVFLTTGAVLSHIEDYYVEEFLKIINTMPNNSTLFFSENYNKNVSWPLWHIRSKDWWRRNLPNWQLYFCDYENSKYSSGIFGVCVGKKNILPNKIMGLAEKIFWKISIIINILERIIQKILSKF